MHFCATISSSSICKETQGEKRHFFRQIILHTCAVYFLFSQTVYCWVLNSFLRGVQLFPGGVRLSGCLHFICLPAWQFICLPVWLVVSGSPDVSLDLFSWAEGFLAVSHLSSTRPVNMLALTIQHGVLMSYFVLWGKITL